jgi:hypothetical protein
VSPLPRLAAAAAALLLLAGCSLIGSRPYVPGRACADGAGTRTDLAGLAERVALPGRPAAVVWTAVSLTGEGGRVEAPGPTDVELTAVLDAGAGVSFKGQVDLVGAQGTQGVPECLGGLPAPVEQALGSPDPRGYRPAQGDWFTTPARLGSAYGPGNGVLLAGGRYAVVTVQSG